MTTDSTLQPRGHAADGDRAPQGRGIGRLAALAVVGVTTVVIAAGAAFGLWYLPFIAGLFGGARTFARRPGFVRTIAALAMLGPVPWSAVLILLALEGDAIGGIARTAAALAGLPPFAAVTFLLTLLVALLEAAVGNWLGRALFRLLNRDGPGRRALSRLRRGQTTHVLTDKLSCPE